MGDAGSPEETLTEPATAGVTPLARLKLACWALPYGLLIAAAGSLGPALWGPVVATGVAVFAIHQQLYRGPWRHPAGWILTLGLLVPTVELVAWGRTPLVGLLAVPALVLALAARLGGDGAWRRWQERPLRGAALYGGLTVILLTASRGPLDLPPPGDDLLAALSPQPAAPEISAAQMHAAVEAVEEAAETWLRAGPTGGDASKTCDDPPAAEEVGGVREVHVSLWRDDDEMARGEAAGGTLTDDLCRATVAAVEGVRDAPAWADATERLRVRIDLSGPAERLRARPVRDAVRPLLRLLAGAERDRAADARGAMAQLVYDLEPGIDGVEIRLGEQRGVALPGDAVLRGWYTPRVRGRADKVERLLVHAARDIRRGPSAWREPGAQLWRFRCTSFGRPVPGEGVLRFHRSNVPLEEVDADAMLAGATGAAAWLGGRVRSDGSFDYEVYPGGGGGGDEYNAVRHAGCVVGFYRMAALGGHVSHPGIRSTSEYGATGAVAEAWVLQRVRVPPGSWDPQMRAVVWGERGATAGAAAFAILSILERPDAIEPDRRGAPPDDELLEGLGLFLLAMTDDAGRVFETWDDARGGERVEGVEHPYFPGLVVLALAELYGATGDERWLDGARRVADAQIALFESERPTPGHWTMQGLWELYRLTGDEGLARANLAMGDLFAAEQFPPYHPLFPDYRGAFHRDDDLPRTIRAASRCEALGAVVDTARALGEDPTPYEDALIGAARHLLENQFQPQNSYYLPRRGDLVGAVRLGLVDDHCRIDGNKHAMLGLVQAWRVARRQGGEEAPDPWPLTPGSGPPHAGDRDVQEGG